MAALFLKKLKAKRRPLVIGGLVALLTGVSTWAFFQQKSAKPETPQREAILKAVQDVPWIRPEDADKSRDWQSTEHFINNSKITFDGTTRDKCLRFKVQTEVDVLWTGNNPLNIWKATRTEYVHKCPNKEPEFD